MVHYYYNYPHLYAYFYLQGCVFGLFLELYFSDHCGTFVVGLLEKNAQFWLLNWPIEVVGSEVIFHWGFWAMWAPRGILCGIAVYIVISYGLTCGKGLQYHYQHSSSAQFDSQSFIDYICSFTPRGNFTLCISWHYVLLFYISWDVVLSLGKGNLVHVGLLPSIICTFYVMLLCME